jgi:hypothetical protein
MIELPVPVSESGKGRHNLPPFGDDLEVIHLGYVTAHFPCFLFRLSR